MRSVQCKWFNYGDGQCQFGSSCFYKHLYRDGSEEQSGVRFMATSDNASHVHNTGIDRTFLTNFLVRLSEFIEAYENKQ